MVTKWAKKRRKEKVRKKKKEAAYFPLFSFFLFYSPQAHTRSKVMLSTLLSKAGPFMYICPKHLLLGLRDPRCSL